MGKGCACLAKQPFPLFREEVEIFPRERCAYRIARTIEARVPISREITSVSKTIGSNRSERNPMCVKQYLSVVINFENVAGAI